MIRCRFCGGGWPVSPVRLLYWLVERRKMENFSRNHKRLFQFGEYMVSGGVYFWVGYLLLDLFYYAWHWNLWWSTIVSNLVGWSVNYLLQRFWAFNNASLKEQKTRVTERYISITLVDFLLNYLILDGLRAISITPAIGQFISAAFFTGWNYLWYRFWVFPEKGDELELKTTVVRLFMHRAHGHSTFAARKNK